MTERQSAAIELALRMLKCSQKELALKLGVSPTQITKWKGGEYMSLEMEGRIKKLINIGDHDPAVVLWAGSVAEAEKWHDLFRRIADMADDDSETGYDTYPLQDELGLLSWSTVNVLTEMGVAPPKQYPSEVDDEDEQWDFIGENAYSSLVYKIYKSLTDVYGFYEAYVDELIHDKEELLNTSVDNIEPCLIHLAASKVEDVDEKFAPKLGDFKYRTNKDYTKWLTRLKNYSIQTNTPLRAELMDMVNDDHDSLGQTAEAESLGFNKSRLHPDIYMNELLVGMRTIHQVLPAMMKKLGMDEKDFSLDTSELNL